MKRVMAIAASVILLTLAILFWGSIEDSPPPPGAASTPSELRPQRPVELDQQTAHEPAAIDKPAAVKIEGFAVRRDGQGNLLPGPETRALFDSLARQQGPLPADQWKDHILESYRQRLGEPAYTQLEALLNRYIEYNLALQLLPMDGVASLGAALDHVGQIRQEYLGEANAAMFQDWQQMETFTRQFVEQVTSSSQDVAQLQQALQEQVYALPVTVQANAQKVLDQSQDLFNALSTSTGADRDLIQGIAEQMAARALMQPDFTFGEPSAEFMSQYNRYTSARQNLLATGRIQSEDDPELAALRQRYFSGPELLRVKTLDRAEMY
ncbi:lipase secretion chaperone [Ketobacter sp.]|uniref:lipase secretion chaperone n=1 Tax=Ketobacter sp. TaxID=2083498 RepID=UPI000F215829|nr:lipase secretion chaperone [Ketobacter sp.]RLU01029.1 MAG: hypothetical protein D9N14_03490 [Ketobacter sp.]